MLSRGRPACKQSQSLIIFQVSIHGERCSMLSLGFEVEFFFPSFMLIYFNYEGQIAIKALKDEKVVHD